jgi:Skp family chaperone for outer membrane proteins
MTGCTVSLYGCKCADDVKRTCVQGPVGKNIGSQAALDEHLKRTHNSYQVDLVRHCKEKRENKGNKVQRLFFKFSAELQNGKPNPNYHKLANQLKSNLLVNDVDWTDRENRDFSTLGLCGCHVKEEALIPQNTPKKGLTYKLNLDYPGGALIRPYEIAQQQGTTGRTKRTPARERAAITQSTPLLEHYKDNTERLEETVNSLKAKLDKLGKAYTQQTKELQQSRREVEDLRSELAVSERQMREQDALNKEEVYILRLQLLAERQRANLAKESVISPATVEQRKHLYNIVHVAIHAGKWEFTFDAIRRVCDTANATGEFQFAIASLPDTLKRKIQSGRRQISKKDERVSRKTAMLFLLRLEQIGERNDLVSGALHGLKGRKRERVLSAMGVGKSKRQARRDDSKTVAEYPARIEQFLRSICLDKEGNYKNAIYLADDDFTRYVH